MQANQLQAGIEDRRQQWQIQKASADQDELVAAAQVQTSRDQLAIATYEQAVAQKQNDQAQAALILLQSQFTNPDLYKWISDTLGGVYRYFLQQATATARLAQSQLAFERAEPARTFIRTDYWRTPAAASSSAPPSDRRGMTGAEQLAQDLSQLDQYAFSTDTRRLNLSQTFSLAQLVPVEFIRFRETGQISFSTPKEWFDQDFPGHYQRLIREVHVNVVALVPPNRGIRATLASSGISRVTTGKDGSFSDVLLRRDPPTVALTSPINATGVFQVDLQSDMLLPFEGSGVCTSWTFELPRAANPFDFATISDVLVTIDYAALSDAGLRAQVVARLNADLTRHSDCVFSLARDFPDQWYQLVNADPAASSRSATLSLTPSNFPPNLAPDSLHITQLALQLVGGSAFGQVAITMTHGQASGTASTDFDGIVSTRRGAAGWNALIGGTPVGAWSLSLDGGVAPLLQSGAISDMLLVVSWSGQSPVWPS